MQAIGQTQRLRCDISLGSVIGHVLIWFLLGIVSCGILLFFYPYSAGAKILNRTRIVDNNGHVIASLHCPPAAGSDFVHALIWYFVVIFTLGVGALMYPYYLAGVLMKRTNIQAV